MSVITKVVVSNLEYLLKKHRLRPSHLVDAAKQKGFVLSKTFMSRLLNGDHDFRISKGEALIEALKVYEPGLQGYELFVPDYFSAQSTQKEISQEELLKVCQKLVIELVDLGWVQLREDIPASIVADLMASAIKNNTPLQVSEKAHHKAVL